MEKYYASVRQITTAILLLAITCIYISADYFGQSVVLQKARFDFGWWVAFQQFESKTQYYKDYFSGKSNRDKIDFSTYYEELGYCRVFEVKSNIRVEVSNHSKILKNIEPSFYPPVAEMPYWVVDLDLIKYEPTMLTDLVFSLIVAESKGLKKDDITEEKISLERLKRLKQLRGHAQYFNIELKEGADAPFIYRKIYEEFSKQKIKIPGLDLEFNAKSGLWIIVVIITFFGVSFKNQISNIDIEKIRSFNEPWIIFDANTFSSKVVSTLWMIFLILTPFVVLSSLITISFMSAWIDGFTDKKLVYFMTIVGILMVSLINVVEIISATKNLWLMRAVYWKQLKN